MIYTITITGSILLIGSLLYFFKFKKSNLAAAHITTAGSTVDETTYDEQDMIVEIDNAPAKTQDELEDQTELAGDVISIFLVAEKDKPYAGFDLLQTLLTNGLRFGQYKIFHYLELDKSLFSLACAHHPGTFEIDKMANFTTSGLCMFMQAHRDAHVETSFEKMLQTAQVITKELGGYLLDDQRNELTDSRIQELRMIVRRRTIKTTITEQHDNTQ